jgi:hypothetical protein
MARKTQVKVATSFNLGDRVRIKDLVGQVGRIEELRGPLGPGGATVYRVKVQKKLRPSSIEVLGNQLEFLPMTGEVAQVRPHRTTPKTSRVKKGG